MLDIDILRADALSCFSGAPSITPNLCKLARSGVYFSNNIGQSYWTLPSELSILTGKYPNSNGVWDMTAGSLPPESKTLAERFGSAGYATYYYGQRGDALPSKRNGGLRGYGTSVLSENDASTWLELLKKAFNRKTPILFHMYTGALHMPYTLTEGQMPLKNIPKPNGLPVYDDEFLTVWRQYLLQHYREVFTHQSITNHPEIFEADPAEREKRIEAYFRRLEREGDYTQRKMAWKTYYNSYLQFVKRPEDNAYLRMLYDSELHYLDQKLAPLLSFLEQPEVASHTVVVIMSSHGESFGEHGIYSHESSPYNALYHVPLIVIVPHMRPKYISAVTENIDVYPTLLALAGFSPPTGAQGESLVPVMIGNRDIQAKPYAISINDDNVYVVQTKRYALVTYKDHSEPDELYDLISDPGETNNIASRNPGVVRQYLELLISGPAPELREGQQNKTTPDGIEKEKLIRGGYF